jgi:hypothetical protein
MPGKFETIPFVPILKASQLYQIVNNGDFNRQSIYFLPCRPTYHPNSIRPSAKQPERVGFDCVMDQAFGTLSGRQRKNARQTKAVPFWLDKASIGG